MNDLIFIGTIIAAIAIGTMYDAGYGGLFIGCVFIFCGLFSKMIEK